MALTINDQPDQFTPAFSPMPFVVFSTNNSSANFKYIADIYVSGVTSPTYIRVESAAHPTSGRGFFDIGEVIRKYVTSNIGILNSDIEQNINSYAAYEVKFGEQYGASGSVTVYPSITVTGTKFAFNGVVDFIGFRTYTQTPYLVNNSSTIAFLTSGTTTQSVQPVGSRSLHWMCNQNSAAEDVYIETFNSGGTSEGSYFIANPYNVISGNDDRFLRVAIGTRDLLATGTAVAITGGFPIITSRVSYYIVYIRDLAGTRRTQIMRYNIDRNCYKFAVRTLHWRNKLGGMDSFDFTLKADQPTDIERTMYRRLIGSYSTGVWQYNSSDAGEADYHVKINDRISLITNYTTEAEANWLMTDLLESGEVYYEYSSTELLRVRVLNKSYTKYEAATGELFQLVIELQFAYQRYGNI